MFCLWDHALSLLLNDAAVVIEVRLRATLLEAAQTKQALLPARRFSEHGRARAGSLLRVRQFLSIGREALRMLTTTALMTLALLYLLPGERGLVPLCSPCW